MNLLETLLKSTTFDTAAERCVCRPCRVAAIEVGSRAIRLLVVDVLDDLRVKVLCSRGKEMYLAQYVDEDDETLSKKLEEIQEVVEKFIVRAKEKDVEKIEIFGTEAIRQIVKKRESLMRKFFPTLMVLDKRAEAFCSFIAVAKSLPWVAPDGEDIFILDQGGGSMEIALGRRTDTMIEIKEYKSYRIGTHELVELLHEHDGDVAKFLNALQQKIIRYSGIPMIDSKTRIVTLGSAATRMAWFTIRQQVGGMYSTTKVHGKVIEALGMERIVKKAIEDKNRTRRYVGFQNNTTREYEQFITGIAAFSEFLQTVGKKRSVVCGWGTRYGFALLLAASVNHM
ncbi:MAG: hypothetical protein V1652_00440 [bacterium]